MNMTWIVTGSVRLSFAFWSYLLQTNLHLKVHHQSHCYSNHKNIDFDFGELSPNLPHLWDLASALSSFFLWIIRHVNEMSCIFHIRKIIHARDARHHVFFYVLFGEDEYNILFMQT